MRSGCNGWGRRWGGIQELAVVLLHPNIWLPCKWVRCLVAINGLMGMEILLPLIRLGGAGGVGWGSVKYFCGEHTIFIWLMWWEWRAHRTAVPTFYHWPLVSEIERISYLLNRTNTLYWGRIKFLGTSNVSHTLVYGMVNGSKGSMVAWLVGKVVKMYRLRLSCCFFRTGKGFRDIGQFPPMIKHNIEPHQYHCIEVA